MKRYLLLSATVACLASACALPENSHDLRIFHASPDQPSSNAGPPVDAGFEKLPETSFILPRGPNGQWLRIETSGAGASENLLVVTRRPVHRIELWAPPYTAPASDSFFQPGVTNGYSHQTWVFSLPEDRDAGHPLYLRLVNTRSLPLTMRLTNEPIFRPLDQRFSIFSTTIFAVLAVMVLVSVAFYSILRERTYIDYAAYIACLLVFLMLNSGAAYFVPILRRLGGLGVQGIALFGVLASIFAASFGQRFARFDRFAPRLDRVVTLIRWGLVGVAALVILRIPALDPVLRTLLNLSLVILGPLMLVAAFVAYRRGSRYAGFFLLGWTPMNVLTWVRSLLALGLISDSWWAEHGLEVAAAFEAIVLNAGLADRALKLRRERDQARRLAELDPLTGLFNRGAIRSRVRTDFANALSGGPSVSLLFLDIDHFKRVNDEHGHPAGDTCLRTVAQRFGAQLRAGDTLGRYGGEEFLAALPGASEADAVTIAERVREAIAALPVEHNGTPIRVTASIGVASITPKMRRSRELLETADATLYRAKSNGRNRVEWASSAEASSSAALSTSERSQSA